MGGLREHIVHVDMDAFFVEVERKRDPALVGVPVVVGGLGGRGVVASASYEARRAGVHSAMPISEARRRLPHGRFLVADHAEYRRVSSEVFGILEAFTPIIEPVSIDEAFLDISGLTLHFGDPHQVALGVRSAIREELGLPASAGAATTKLLAKLASEQAKPDGQMVIVAGTELEFLRPLGVRSLWGVGEATFASLEAMGVKTVGDLADLPEDMVVRRLGHAVGAHLWALAHNVDDRRVTPGDTTKSISTEATFESDLADRSEIDEELFRLCARLSDRLRAGGLAARTVSIKVRFGDFSTVTRSHTAEAPIDLTSDLFEVATALAARAGAYAGPVRLLGASAAGLTGAHDPRQLGFGQEQRQALAAASDEVRKRFGPEAVKPARLIATPDLKRKEGPPVY